MALPRIIKENTFIRGFYYLYKRYFYNVRKRLGYCGKNVVISPPYKIQAPHNIYLYDNTNIYEDSYIAAGRAKFIMKENSGAAMGLKVITGNHMSIVGKSMKEVTNKDKLPDFDKDVIVEEDVWLATNVTLLAGVTIGRGAIIGAGSVVRNSIPPYAIAIGNPAKVIGFKFTPQEVKKHEEIMFDENNRLSIEEYKLTYRKYFLNRIKEIKSFTKL